MQSIYSFREADVRLFLQAQAGDATMLGALTVTSLRLVANFRSHPSVVDWINDTFAQVLPAIADVTAGAVPFSAAVPARIEPAVTPTDPVSVHLTPEDDVDREAHAVVDLVAETHAANPEATIGILARAKDHLSAILQALTRADIRYRAEAIDSLDTRPVVLDLMALTRTLLHPLDRIAWLACLRAPWCGLTLADLHALVTDRPGVPCMDLLEDDSRLAMLGPDARARCRRVRRVLRATLAARGRRRLRDRVEGAWIALGGPACVNAPALKDADDFLELLATLEIGQTITGAEVIADRLSLLFARPDASADDRVQIMTIHKAKGLEFDVVILPGLGRGVRTDTPSILRWREHEDGLLLAPLAPDQTSAEDPLYAMIRCLTADAQRHETGRLLYVAATRARRALHLFGSADPVRGPRRGSLLEHLWPALERNRVAPSTSPVAPPARPVPALATPRLHRLPPSWQLPRPAPSLTTPDSSVTDVTTPGERISFRWAGETARHVGTVVHELLCNIARDGIERWPRSRVDRMRPAVRTALTAASVPAGEHEAAASRALALIGRVLGDERGRWLLKRHRGAASELAITGVIGGRVHHVRLDRTFIDEAGVRWIVDIKTSAHEGGHLDAFLDEERERYRAELERYGAIVAALDRANGTPYPIRLALYYPDIPGWREWTAPT
jgi:hypothetical protein